VTGDFSDDLVWAIPTLEAPFGISGSKSMMIMSARHYQPENFPRRPARRRAKGKGGHGIHALLD